MHEYMLAAEIVGIMSLCHSPSFVAHNIISTKRTTMVMTVLAIVEALLLSQHTDWNKQQRQL